MSRTSKPPTDEPAIRVVMMPRDTNAEGTIFGGVILSYIDQAAFVEARRQAHHRYVTVCMREVVFKEPVFMGDVLSLYGETARLGKTSITVSRQGDGRTQPAAQTLGPRHRRRSGHGRDRRAMPPHRDRVVVGA
jgi:acyl-coenzyme A thioesterase PaaI-like protein